MKSKLMLLGAALCLSPLLSHAEGKCNTDMTQPQAYGELTLSCATGIFDYDKVNGTRRACAKLSVPDSEQVVHFESNPFTMAEKSDFKLRMDVCVQAAMEVKL